MERNENLSASLPEIETGGLSASLPEIETGGLGIKSESDKVELYIVATKTDMSESSSRRFMRGIGGQVLSKFLNNDGTYEAFVENTDTPYVKVTYEEYKTSDMNVKKVVQEYLDTLNAENSGTVLKVCDGFEFIVLIAGK